MVPKLKCVIVDDDRFSVEMLTDMCKESSFAQITNSFTNPEIFLQSLPKLEFDLCFLDLRMPKISGIEVAQRLSGKPVIFVTAQRDMAYTALDYSPVDIITKPILKGRLNAALTKANKLLNNINNDSGKEYEVFNISGERGKTLLRIEDMLYFVSDEKDCRNKYVSMRDGQVHLLMNCTFQHLKLMSADLVRINRSEMISIKIVRGFEQDTIMLNTAIGKLKITQLTLNRGFRQNFKRHVFSW